MEYNDYSSFCFQPISTFFNTRMRRINQKILYIPEIPGKQLEFY